MFLGDCEIKEPFFFGPAIGGANNRCRVTFVEPLRNHYHCQVALAFRNRINFIMTNLEVGYRLTVRLTSNFVIRLPLDSCFAMK